MYLLMAIICINSVSGMRIRCPIEPPVLYNTIEECREAAKADSKIGHFACIKKD